MDHADFLNDPEGRHFNWRLTNWAAAVGIALGGRALLLFRGAFAALLFPALILAGYSLYSHRPALLIFALLSCCGFWTSSPGPTGIGIVANGLIALIGTVCGVMLHDWLLVLSAMLPGVTWFGSCAILGTTASYMTEALRKSETSFQMLVRRHLLKATAVAKPGPAPKGGGNSGVADRPPSLN